MKKYIYDSNPNYQKKKGDLRLQVEKKPSHSSLLLCFFFQKKKNKVCFRFYNLISCRK